MLYLTCERCGSQGCHVEDNRGQGVISRKKLKEIKWCGCVVRGPLTHDPGAPSIASQYNFIVQPLVTKEWNARAF